MRTRRLGPMILGLSLVIGGALIILVYYYQKAGGRLPFAAQRYSFNATVNEPGKLQKHADVRAAGVKVGEVNGVTNRITPQGTFAVLELAINKGKGLDKVYRDARIAVRQKTLVGENYVSVEPGTPKGGELPKGATLGLSSNDEVVPLDKILATVDDPTRKSLSTDFRSLGAGFDNRAQDFSQTLSSLGPLFQDGGKTVAILDGQKRQVAEAIASTGAVTKAVADRGRDAQTLVRAVKRTAQSVNRRDSEVKAFFNELPPTLKQARSTVSTVSGFSGRATPVISDVRSGLVALRSPVRDLGPTATQTRTFFKDLTPALKVAEPLVSQLNSFSKTSLPAIPSLDAFMRQTNPFLRYVKPYDRDIAAFMSNFSSGHYQQTFFGRMTDCSCAADYDTLIDGLPANVRQAADVLLKQGIVQKINKKVLNHYRAPGQLPDQSIEQPAFPKVQADDK